MKEMKFFHKLTLFFSSLSPLFLYLIYKLTTLEIPYKIIAIILLSALSMGSITIFFYHFRKRKEPDYELKIKSFDSKTSSKIKEILPYILFLLSSELLNLTIISTVILILYYLILYYKDEESLLLNPLFIVWNLNLLEVKDKEDNKYLLLTKKKKIMKESIIEFNCISGRVIRQWN